jgi:hypothetical protein
MLQGGGEATGMCVSPQPVVFSGDEREGPFAEVIVRTVF